MCASRILPLARTSRWAIVASETRNARAISAVARPPSSRSVSATCAGSPSDGWQQVKISRRRSSCTGPTSSTAARSACSSIAWACRSARVASRRSRSIARLRAVVMIQPAGLGGTPSSGHRTTAVVNASATASSATSTSPNTRTRTATARAYCSRNTCSTGCSTGTPGSLPALEGAHLDRQRGGPGQPGAPVQRRVEVGDVDDREAAQVLLALRVGTVGGQHLAVADPQDGGRAGRVQPAGEHPDPGLVHRPVHLADVGHDPVQVRRRLPFAGLDHAEQVLRHGVLLPTGASLVPALTLCTNGSPQDRQLRSLLCRVLPRLRRAPLVGDPPAPPPPPQRRGRPRRPLPAAGR